MIPVAFYAPLKSPNHPAPSGDRTMARLLLRALEAAGFAPEPASELRSHEPAGDEARQRAIEAEGRREADRLIAAISSRPEASRPRAWFTYHGYYKAPDHLGPRVSEALGIPYAVAEGSRAGKRAGGAWAFAHACAEAGLDRADLLFVMTANDREALERAARPGQRLVDLPPFEEAGPAVVRPERAGPPRLLAVAMMRPGDKVASYRLLAEALALIWDAAWMLDVVGDGPERTAVEDAFRELRQRVAFHGALAAEALGRLYAAADLMVWPAVNEAYGMVLLEAQAAGCPVVAGGYGGVRDALRDGVTGVVTPPGDAAAFAEAVADLLADPARRGAMGLAARRFIVEERSLSHAAAILREALNTAIGAVR